MGTEGSGLFKDWVMRASRAGLIAGGETGNAAGGIERGLNSLHIAMCRSAALF